MGDCVRSWGPEETGELIQGRVGQFLVILPQSRNEIYNLTRVSIKIRLTLGQAHNHIIAEEKEWHRS